MPRKGENIYKRKDGRWEGRYITGRCGTKARYGYIYGKSYSEVKKALAIKRAKVIQEDAMPSGQAAKDDKYSSVALLWSADIKSKVKESTWVKYQNLLNAYILPAIGDKYISRIDYAFISDLCTELLSKGGASGLGLSCKTVSDTLSVVRASLKYAIRMKYAVDHSALDVTVKVKAQNLRIFAIQEQQTLLSYLMENQDLTSVGILICFFTGIRIGELCALTWGDISITGKTMHIHSTMQRIQTPDGPTKTKVMITEPKSLCSIRDIPLPKILLDLLPTQRPEDAFVLTGEVNHFVEPRTIENRFKKILEECHIKNANFHVLRHTFATRCVELGFDIKSLSEILGHANVSITLNRYVHPSMDLKQKNMDKLSELFTVK